MLPFIVAAQEAKDDSKSYGETQVRFIDTGEVAENSSGQPARYVENIAPEAAQASSHDTYPPELLETEEIVVRRFVPSEIKSDKPFAVLAACRV